MDAFEVARIIAAHRQAGQLYHEFLRADTLSVGLYVLPTGTADPQQPHTEDEVYYVIEGKGVIQVGEETRPVGAGSIVFVEANVDHRFHSISETLTILVFFAPPRRSQAAPD